MATLHPRHAPRSHHPHPSHTNPPANRSTSWHVPSRSATFHGDEDVPWHHMAHAYTWVVENGYNSLERTNRKTEQWILQQQTFMASEGGDLRSAGRGPSLTQRKAWEDMIYSYEIEAEQWMRHEEEARRRAAEKERRARLVDEEMRRIETRMRIKREEERKKVAEEKHRLQEEVKERDWRNRLKVEKAILDAWRVYEERWTKLISSSDVLTFSSIPWPMVSAPRKPEDITPRAVVSFLFSQVHSEKQARKERIRRAQLRWHPDRFQRLLPRVKEEDKAQVREGVGVVARCLNDIRL
ncbi:hypothetical protein H0H87_000681 [Tephrocybe sp. NHM501043]|nr:hypothetical protein H0H87_000681 [Tephrocybe sp. NHM501043]